MRALDDMMNPGQSMELLCQDPGKSAFAHNTDGPNGPSGCIIHFEREWGIGWLLLEA